MVTLINPGTTPQVYTTDGKSIGAGERIEDVTLDDVGEASVQAGRLRVLDEESTKDDVESASAPEPTEQDSSDAESTRSPARRPRNQPS